MKDYLNHSFNRDDENFISIIDELPLWSAPFGLDLLSCIRMKRNMKVLDIGCGTGFPLIEIAMRLGSSSKIYGLDPWIPITRRIKQKIETLNLKNVTIVTGFAEKMPFDDRHFDMVVSNNGLNNVQDIEQSIIECSRVMKSGSQFIMTFNLENTMMEFYDVFRMILEKYGMADEIKKLIAHIYSKRKPLEKIIDLLKTAGLGIENVQHKSFRIDFLDGSTMFDHYLIKYWFLDEWKNILSMQDREKIFEETEEHLNNSALNNGSFFLTIPYVIINCIKP